MKVYIDFDGVILLTEDILFKEYRSARENGIILDKINYITTRNWQEIIEEACIINDALKHIARSELELSILTKIHSLHELESKVKYLRKNNLTLEVIGVPYNVKKSDVVNAKGNVLIDDNVSNLEEWDNAGGLSVFFHKDNMDVDTYRVKNDKFPKIDNLNILKSKQKVMSLFTK